MTETKTIKTYEEILKDVSYIVTDLGIKVFKLSSILSIIYDKPKEIIMDDILEVLIGYEHD